MFMPQRLLILPLGLLIAISGCSGGRMRQIFTPDREFMALSELERYDAERAAGGQDSEQSGGILAKLTPDFQKDDTTGNDEDKSLLSRLLPSRQEGPMPTDPFLEDPATEAPDPAMVTVTESQTMPQHRQPQEEQPQHDFDQFMADAAADDSDVPELPPLDEAAVTVEGSAENSNLPTFAEIMSEFEDDPLAEDEEDQLDAWAEAQLAGASAAADEPSADPGPGFSDFEAALADASDEVTETESDSDIPQLSFDMLEEGLDVDDEAEQLLDPTKTVALTEELDQSEGRNSDALGVEQLIESDPVNSNALSLPSLNETAVAKEDSSNEQLRPSSETSADVEVAETPSDSRQNRVPVPGEEIMGDWDFPTGASPMQETAQPAETPLAGEIAATRSDFTPPVYRQPAVTRQPTPAPATLADPAATSFSDDRFLNDFETQATAATVPAAATPTPAVTGGGIRFVGQSPRTWLLLLGAAVIAWLLFAPERPRLRQTNNR